MAEPVEDGIEQGQKWRPVGDAMWWTVVSLSKNQVGLSGPGPCRGMRYESRADLLDPRNWECQLDAGG